MAAGRRPLPATRLVAVLLCAAAAVRADYTATIRPYPGYAGRFAAISGTVELSETSMAYSLAGGDTGGGIHIHAGESCASAEQVGGHLLDRSGGDPWPDSVYSGDAGTVPLPLPVRVDFITGGWSHVIGHPVVIHASGGERIGCGVIEDSTVLGFDGLSLELIGRQLFPTGHQLPAGVGTELGGLSALTYDEQGRWYALSDRGSQFYEIAVDLPAMLRHEPFVTFLRGGIVGGGDPSAPVNTQAAGDSFDAEGLASCRDAAATSAQLLFVSTEDPSRVFAFDKDSGLLASTRSGFGAEIGLERQTPISAATVTHNKQMESLTCAGNGLLITGNEGPLSGDGPAATYSNGASVRIYTFGAVNGQLQHTARYDLDSSTFPDSDATGLVDVEVVRPAGNPDGLPVILTMERSWSPTSGSSIKVFAIDLAAAADVSSCASFTAGCADGAGAAKVELLNLSDLPDGCCPVDNYEGMALGPVLPDGRRLLLLVNDNNYNSHQIGTQFLAFAVTLTAATAATPHYGMACDVGRLGAACAGFDDPGQPAVCGTECEALARVAMSTGLGCSLSAGIQATLGQLVSQCSGGH